MVSVQGSDFGFGEGLSQAAADSANRAIGEIVRFINCGFKAGQMAKAASDQAGKLCNGT